MKKVILLISMFIMIPLNVKANNIDEIKFTKENIYDYANIISEETYDEINKSINKFALSSQVSIKLVTVNNVKEGNKLINKIYSDNRPKSFRKNNPSILIIYTADMQMEIITISDSKYGRWSGKELQKLEVLHINKLKNEYIVLSNISNVIDSWTSYFSKNNFVYILISAIVSIIISKIYIKRKKDKYEIKEIKQVNNYLIDEKVKLLTK